jgi:drug/metabolite transporter (DMT)-like permease
LTLNDVANPLSDASGACLAVEMTRPVVPGWQVWTALWLVYVLWGSTYLAIAYVVDTVPPLVGMGLRFGVAALLLLAYVSVRRGRAALQVTRRQLRSAAVVGLLLLLGGNGLVAVAEAAELPSGWRRCS